MKHLTDSTTEAQQNDGRKSRRAYGNSNRVTVHGTDLRFGVHRISDLLFTERTGEVPNFINNSPKEIPPQCTTDTEFIFPYAQFTLPWKAVIHISVDVELAL